MQSKTLFAMLAISGIFGATALISNVASAHGFFGFGKADGQKLEDSAEALGLDAETLRTDLETKDFAEVVKEQGLSQSEFRTQMLAQLRSHLAERGLSEEEINEKISAMEERHQDMMQSKADLLGISVDELEAQLEEKSFPELLDEYGITHVELHEKMRTERQSLGDANGRGHPRGHGFLGGR